MLEALARSIAETAADALGTRAATPRAKVSDEEIGLYLWHERGFRDHDTLVSLINHTREILDRREVEAAASHQPSKPRRVRRTARQSPIIQLALDLVTA
jgi:hypothetical protein